MEKVSHWFVLFSMLLLHPIFSFVITATHYLIFGLSPAAFNAHEVALRVYNCGNNTPAKARDAAQAALAISPLCAEAHNALGLMVAQTYEEVTPPINKP